MFSFHRKITTPVFKEKLTIHFEKNENTIHAFQKGLIEPGNIIQPLPKYPSQDEFTLQTDPPLKLIISKKTCNALEQFKFTKPLEKIVDAMINELKKIPMPQSLTLKRDKLLSDGKIIEFEINLLNKEFYVYFYYSRQHNIPSYEWHDDNYKMIVCPIVIDLLVIKFGEFELVKRFFSERRILMLFNNVVDDYYLMNFRPRPTSFVVKFTYMRNKTYKFKSEIDDRILPVKESYFFLKTYKDIHVDGQDSIYHMMREYNFKWSVDDFNNYLYNFAEKNQDFEVTFDKPDEFYVDRLKINFEGTLVISEYDKKGETGFYSVGDLQMSLLTFELLQNGYPNLTATQIVNKLRLYVQQQHTEKVEIIFPERKPVGCLIS